MIKICLDALDKTRQAVFNRLQIFKKAGGFLGGGTAIALQIGHRISKDFDVFFPGEITEDLKSKLFKILVPPVSKRLDNDKQLTVIDAGGVQATLANYQFPPLHPLIATESLSLLSLADLASNKAYVISKRGVWRDYVDLYFLLKEGRTTLDQVIQDSQKRFGDDFSPKLFLEQLIYTADITDFHIDFIKKECLSKEIISYLEKLTAEFV